MRERTGAFAGRRLVLAWAAALGVVPAAAAAASGATTEPSYTVLSLKAATSSTQIAHIGPGQDGDGATDVELGALTRPRFTLPATQTPRRVSLRVGGSVDAHARFVLAARGSLPGQVVECESALRLAPRAAPVTFQAVRGAGGRRLIRVRLTLPYVRAPYVEANDLFPPSGPCPLQHQKLTVTRSVPARFFDRERLVLAFGGKRTASAGDITYTTSWAVTLTLARRSG